MEDRNIKRGWRWHHFFYISNNKDSKAQLYTEAWFSLHRICCMPVCAEQENLAGAIQGCLLCFFIFREDVYIELAAGLC